MQLRALGVRSIPANANVTTMADCRDMVDKTLAEFGKVDILVTIPALMIYRDFAHCTPEQLRQQTDVTFWGTVNAVKAVVDAMTRQRSAALYVWVRIQPRWGQRWKQCTPRPRQPS
jgi:NADP-dependent 3-hydroxy acid dehydrogenase YdfG